MEEYKCKLTTVNSKRLDQKAIETDLPEVYNKYIKPTSYQRFTATGTGSVWHKKAPYTNGNLSKGQVTPT